MLEKFSILYVLQRERRLQYVIFDMLNKYFIAQIAENIFILHWEKKSQNRNIGQPFSGWNLNKN